MPVSLLSFVTRHASGAAPRWNGPRRIIGLAVLVVLALLPVSAWAQAPPLTWEKVGGNYAIRGLDFDEDGALWGASSSPGNILKLPPGATDWVEVNDDGYRDIVVTLEAYVIAFTGIGLRRSTDGGETFENVHDDGGALFEVREGPRAGLLLSGTSGNSNEGGVGPGAAYSTDGGATWTSVEVDVGTTSFGGADAFAAVVSGPHAGRVVAGCQNGLAYSDDGGATWTLTLWQPFRYWGHSFARLQSGRILAGVEDTQVSAGLLYASDDGAAWTLLHDFESRPVEVRTLGPGSGPGGDERVVAVDLHGAVWLSDDEGETWAQTDSVYTGPSTGLPIVNDVAVGPEGRLYVALIDAGPIDDNDGLYRTTEPVVVASEEAPVRVEPSRLSVYPNPAAGSATLALVLTEAAEARVAVFDLLGREVIVLHDGRLGAGEHRLTLDGAVLPSGVYVVSISSNRLSMTQTVTVLR